MKYIRTKDGRILDLKNYSVSELVAINAETNETTEDICYTRSWFEYHGDYCIHHEEHISKNSQVVAESDNLEDLFDCHVIILNGKPRVIEKDTHYVFQGGRMSGKTNAISKPFGAIWVFNENKVPELKCVAQIREGVWKLL